MNRRPLSPLHRISVLLALAGWPVLLHAASLTWDITAGDGATTTDGAGTWTTGAGNWNTGAGDTTWNNATPDSAIFGSNNPAGSYAVSLGGPITTGGLTFNAGTTYTVTGNTLTLSGTPNISVAASTTANIGSILAGTGFTKTGTGTLTLNNATDSTYSGLVTVSQGTLNISGTSGDGTILGNLTINNGATATLGAANPISNSSLITIQSGGTFNRNGQTDVVGGLSGAGNLIGTGILRLEHIASTAATFTGAISGGEIYVRGQNGTGGAKQVLQGTLSGTNLFVQKGNDAGDTAWLELSGAGTTTLTGLLEVANDPDGNNNTPAGGLGATQLDIGGTHTVSTPNLYIGAHTQGATVNQSGGTVNITTGNLRLGHWPGATSNYNLSSGVINFNAANPGSDPSTSGATEQNGGLYIGIDGVGVFTQSGGTINTKFVVMDNRGDSAGTDTYTMTGGTLNLAGSFGFQRRNATGTVNLGGGTIQATATTQFTSPANLSGTGGSTTLEPTGTNVLTFSGALSGSGGLNKTGTGTLILSGANTYLGNTVINASSGTVQIGGGGAVGAAGGAISLGASSTLRLFRNDTWTLPNNISGAGTLYIGSTTAAVETDYVNLTGDNSGFTGPVTINMGGVQINDSNGLGTGTKTVTMNNGTAGNPFIRLNGAGGDITLPSTISYTTSVALNQGAIVNVAGNNTINGAVSMTTGGGDTVLNSLGGSLTMAGNLTFAAGGRNLNLKGNANGTISGVVANGGQTAVGLAKSGTGSWTLANPANTYNGTTQVTGGLLLVSSGNEGSLGLNPGSYTAGQLTLNGGGLGITGSSLTINDTNRGITIGASGGTFSPDTGLTLTVANTINGSSGQLNKAGAGTFNLTAGTHALGSFNVTAGTFTQSGGTVNTPTGTVGASGTYRLAGGKLRLDALNITGGFDWTGGTLTHYTTGTSIAMLADNSSVGFQQVGAGRTAVVTGDLSSGAGAVLALHGSPTLYESLGIRFNNFSIIGSLALAGVGDVLEMEFNPYLLRPFSTLGEGAIEYGSLPLVTWTGSYDGNTFDTVTGIGNDGRGFALSTFSVVDASALDINTYFLEYDAAAKTLWFHYKVNGYVPEPDTFALLALSVIGLRTARTLRERRARLA